MKIIHGTPRTATKDCEQSKVESQKQRLKQTQALRDSLTIHGIAMHHRNMRVAGNGRRPFHNQGRPSTRVDIKHMCVAHVSGSIVSPKQDEGILVCDQCGPITSPGSPSQTGDGRPLTGRKVKFVQIRLVRTIVPTKDKETVFVDRRGMRMTCRRRSTLQGKDFPPGHCGKIKGPKVSHTRGSVKASMNKERIAKGHSNVTISRGWWKSRVRRGQNGRPSLVGKGKGVKCID